MTIDKILETVAEVKPSQFGDEYIVKWINDVEQILIDELFSLYETGLQYHDRYEYPEDSDRPLIVPDPYSDIYLYYVYSQIDFNNGELAKYNNDYLMFNSLYSQLFSFWNKRFKRKGQAWRY